MPEPNGYRIAKQLADIKPDPPVIIFITRAAQYAAFSFGIAFHYLVKPVCYERFASIMDRAMRFISPRQLTFQYEGEFYIIPTKDIYYIEVIRSTSYIHCKSQTYTVRLTMKQIVKALAGIDFFRVHHSYLINLRYVDHIAPDNVTLITQDVIPISRANRKEFQLALQSYLRLT